MELSTMTKLLKDLGFSDLNPFIMLHKFMAGITQNLSNNTPILVPEEPYTGTKADLKRELKKQGQSTDILSAIERKLDNYSAMQQVWILKSDNYSAMQQVWILKSDKGWQVLKGELIVKVASYMAAKGKQVNIPCRIQHAHDYTDRDLLTTLGVLYMDMYNNSNNRRFHTLSSFSVHPEDLTIVFQTRINSRFGHEGFYSTFQILQEYLIDPGSLVQNMDNSSEFTKHLIKYLADGNPIIRSKESILLILAAHVCSIHDRYFPRNAPYTLCMTSLGRLFLKDFCGNAGNYLDEILDLYWELIHDPSKAYAKNKTDDVTQALIKDFLINGPPDLGRIYP